MSNRTSRDLDLMDGFRLGTSTIEPLLGRVTLLSGETRSLAKKPMDVLVRLAAARGGVVTRDRLLEDVWGPHSGGDEGLKRCIHLIRRALGDEPQSPRHIDTVHGRGYVCVATVLPLATPPLEPRATQPFTFERRSVCALSALIVWDQPGAQWPDPELVHECWPRLLSDLEREVAELDGWLAHRVAGNLQIVFGYPTAGRNLALRAATAAQAMTRVTRQHQDQTAHGGLRPSIKIGIHAGDILAPAHANIGLPSIEGTTLQVAQLAANRAADMQILLTSSARELLKEGVFAPQVPAELQIGSGRAALFELLTIQSDKLPRSGPQAAAAVFVGREAEREQLQSAWRSVEQGAGRTFVISGDAGIGKSALAKTLIEFAAPAVNSTYLLCRCDEINRRRAFHPVLQQLLLQLRLEDREDDNSRLGAIEDRLARLGFDPHQSTALIADMLDVPARNRYGQIALAAERRRELVTAILAEFLLQSSVRGPRLVVIDDLQFADASTLDLLRAIVDRGPLPHFMLVMTVRPGARIDWTWRAHISQLGLLPLSASESRRIVTAATREPLAEAAIESVIAVANGNPLFLEEMARSADPSPAAHGATQRLNSVPQSLEQVLAARLDSLGRARRVCQVAAVLGLEFRHDALARLCQNLGIEDLEDSLAALVREEIVYQTRSLPARTYVFKHALIRAAAYASILAKSRRELHATAGQLLEQLGPGHPLGAPEYAAEHFAAAGDYFRAATLLHTAGSRAHRQSANVEAERLLQDALANLTRSEPSVARDQLELSIAMTLGPVLMAQRGQSDPEVERVYSRAEALAEQLGNAETLPAALFGLWAYKVVTGALLRAQAIGERLLALADGCGSEDLQLEANLLLGVTSVHLARYRAALGFLDRALTIYDMQKHAAHRFIYGQDPGMAAHVYRALAFMQLEERSQAQAALSTALQITRSVEHPYTSAFALTLAARIHITLQDMQFARVLAEEALGIAKRWGFRTWGSAGEFLLAYLDFREHRAADAIDRMARWLEVCSSLGNSLLALDFMTMLIASMLDAGRIAEAEDHLQRAQSELQRRVFSSDEGAVRQMQESLYRIKTVAALQP